MRVGREKLNQVSLRAAKGFGASQSDPDAARCRGLQQLFKNGQSFTIIQSYFDQIFIVNAELATGHGQQLVDGSLIVSPVGY